MSNHQARILGINCSHDAAACLLINGQIVTAIAEERLTRVKHQGGFPRLAVRYCLDAAGLQGVADIDCIVVNEFPTTNVTHSLQQEGFKGLFIRNPSHHLLHAYHAWIASGFDEAAILVVDGSGLSYGEHKRHNSPHLGEAPEFTEMEEAETLYLVRNGEIQLLEKRWGLWEATEPYFRFPSLGHMYSVASQFIFGHWQHAGKTMGLAPYGDPAALPFQIVSYSGAHLQFNTEWANDLPPPRTGNSPTDKLSRDVAAKVQAELEDAMLYLTRKLHEQTQVPNLCITGGVALNSVANGLIAREGPFSTLYVTPASSDSGTAIGAAFYGHDQFCKGIPRWANSHDFLGRSYDDNEVTDVLHKIKQVNWEQCEDATRLAASDIADGKVIAWFEGGSEFGPRALGHRSILCDARDSNIKNRLNEEVKFREGFRPYAASILQEYTSEYFELDIESPHMLLVARIREGKRTLIPGVRHVDNTCRIQTVSANYRGQYRTLIQEYMAITGIPLILNTSFNIRAEPIVETPADAVRCFLASNIEVLYLQGYRITRIDISKTTNYQELTPVVNDGVSIQSVAVAHAGRWTPNALYITTSTGHKLHTSDIDNSVLEQIDGERSVGDIGSLLGWKRTSQELKSVFAGLQRQGLLSFLVKRK